MLAGILICALAVIAATTTRSDRADAVTADAQGEAFTLEGQVLNLVGLSINQVNLPPGGNAGVALAVGPSIDILGVASLDVGVTADTVQTNCSSVTDADTVQADCFSRIEGLEIGLDLELLGEGLTNSLTPVTAGVLRADAHCSATTTTPICNTIGSQIANLDVGGTPVVGLTPTTIPINASLGVDLGLAVLNTAVTVDVDGSVAVFQVTGSDFGPNGIRTTMLSVDLDLSANATVLGIPTLNIDLGVINIELAVADARLSNLQEDPTPTNTPVTPTATNTSVVPPTVVPPATATPTTPAGSTATSTPPPGSTATSTPPPGSTATSTPPPGSTATSTPPPGSTATSTPAPGATATNTPAPGATATNTPAPGATATNTPAPGQPTNTPPPAATNTPTGGQQPPAGPGDPPGGQQPPAGPGGPPAGVPTPAAPNTGAGTMGDSTMPLPVVFGLTLLVLSAGLMVTVARRTSR